MIGKKAKSKRREKTNLELRMDLVSENWVIVASVRGNKPNNFWGAPLKKCPFCGLKSNEEVFVISNDYPAVSPISKVKEKTKGGIYKKMPARGFHEIVITKNHSKQLADLPQKTIKEVINVWQSRYLALKDKKFVNHISIFQNHGPKSGASITHPHSQIITTPLVDVDLRQALANSKKYYQKNKKCLYCQMTQYELKKKERIVFENEDFVALCPFASRRSFQIIISPKKHFSYFENIESGPKEHLAECFKIVLSKIKKGLGDPSYNFYLHTAPSNGKKHDYYHWHFTILPKTQEFSGFEMGTQLEIINVKPEDAAEHLRKTKI